MWNSDDVRFKAEIMSLNREKLIVMGVKFKCPSKLNLFKYALGWLLIDWT